MKLFNIFSRKKKMTIKQLYAPVLDKMWVCVISFCPWDPSKHDVVIKEVNIVSANADNNGIFVMSDAKNPFRSYSSSDTMRGYIDKIDWRFDYCGFFDTEVEAKGAYVMLMNDWIDVIRSKLNV